MYSAMNITKETNLAPRSSFTYQPFNSPLLRLTTGWNRYYGLNTFANKLQANKRLLQTTETRTGVDKAWKTALRPWRLARPVRIAWLAPRER